MCNDCIYYLVTLQVFQYDESISCFAPFLGFGLVAVVYCSVVSLPGLLLFICARRPAHHYNKSHVVCMHIAASHSFPFLFSLLFLLYRSHPPFPLPSLAISHLSSPPHLPHFCFSSPSLSLSLIFSSPSSTHLGSIQKYKPYLYRFAIGVKDEHSWFRGCDIARRLPFVLIAFFVVLGRPSIILVSIVYLVCK